MDSRSLGAHDKQLDTDELLMAQTDAIALLGNTNYELSLRRREAIKPNLNKEYGALCSSQTAFTTSLFGGELQSQLNAIRASNRISHTAVHNTSSSSKLSWRQKQDKPFYARVVMTTRCVMVPLQCIPV